ncbi:uncharacterized protein LOC134265098 [Saccostrea cucullata]|uniref:uncharacterized protein LOC134265098 n=1 Tax=Saccostrea cuccullata TaxID=36930 RepID=UPI002ED6B244
MMDSLYSAQDVLLCDLCKIAALQSHCEVCNINLCKDCVGEHLSDSSNRHNVVPYTQNLYTKSKDLAKDLEELEKIIYPAYEKCSIDLNSERLDVEKHYEKLARDIIKEGECWQRDINIIVNKHLTEIDGMKTKHMAALIKQEKEVLKVTSDLKVAILDLRKILKSYDTSITSTYHSQNAEFRSLPPKINVSLPSFTSHQISIEHLYQMFGSLSTLSTTIQEHDTVLKASKTMPCPEHKQLLDKPKLTTTIETKYELLYNITCLDDEEVWTCGDDKSMRLFDLQGKLLKTINTKSGNVPCDIAVTRSGDLLYTDRETKTVNIVRNTEMQEIIRLKAWIPYFICCTLSGDFLVTMKTDNGDYSKVVRYSSATEKQTIQFDSKGQPLYSPFYLKHISENKNLDICVADNGANVVVVVNQAGKLRFRYTGHSTSGRSFNPAGITTDCLSQILTLDNKTSCIHILDQDGQFLRYIDSCDLHHPRGICVNTKNYLFVTECHSGKVKRIKYMQDIQ